MGAFLFTCVCGHMLEYVSDPIHFVWEALFDNLSEYHLFVTCSLAFHLLIYWPLCLALMYLDITKSPQWLYKYKIQKRKDHGWSSYKKTITQAIINQVVAYLFAAFVFYTCDYFDYQMTMSRELPSGFTIFWHLVVFALVEEFGFFYSHYIFHNKFFYSRIHSFHHHLQHQLEWHVFMLIQLNMLLQI